MNSLQRQQGLTLLEMVIGMFIGLLLSGSLLAMWLHLQSIAMAGLQQSRLHQDLRAINHIMARDIRRAGYWGWSPNNGMALTQNPFMSTDNDINIDQANTNEAKDSCLTYSYDHNNDGELGDDRIEQFGFRLHQQAIEMRIGGADFSCNSGRWQDITQSGTVITALTFELDSSKKPAGPCPPGQPCRSQRLVDIKLSGHHPSRPEDKITLHERIRIRNDHLSAPS